MKNYVWVILGLFIVGAGSTFAQGPYPRDPQYPRDPRDPGNTPVKNVYLKAGQSLAFMPLESVNVVCQGTYETDLAPCVVNTRIDEYYGLTFVDISVNGKLLSTVSNGGWKEVESQLSRFRTMGLCR